MHHCCPERGVEGSAALPNRGVEAIQNAARVLMEEIKQLMKVPAVQNCRPAMVRCGEALNSATNAM